MVDTSGENPVKLDFLQDIVNVHWGEPPDNVVCFGDGNGWLYRIPPSGIVEHLGILGFLSEGDLGANIHAGPTWDKKAKLFYAAGRKVLPGPAGDDALPYIVKSKDGKLWSGSITVADYAALVGVNFSAGFGTQTIRWLGVDPITRATAYAYADGQNDNDPSGYYIRVVKSTTGSSWAVDTKYSAAFVQKPKETTVDGPEGSITVKIRPKVENWLGGFVAWPNKNPQSSLVELSRDGGPWKESEPLQAGGSGIGVMQVAAGNGALVTAGANGITCSRNGGVEWVVAVPASAGYGIIGVAFAAKWFYTCDLDGNIMKSSNGLTWTTIDQTTEGLFSRSGMQTKMGSGYVVGAK